MSKIVPVGRIPQLAGAAAALVAFAAAVTAAGPASAHPHVFVNIATDVVYKDGKVAAFQHAWTFDDYYSSTAVETLDKNGDGAYSREELAELAQVNMDGLKEVNYFTQVTLGGLPVKLSAPVDPWLEYKNNMLTLHFTLPVEEPVAADAPDLSFSVYDETYYIALEYPDANAVKLSGAPSGCQATLKEPPVDPETQRLSDAFSEALASGSYGQSMAKTVSIACAKS